MSKRVKTEKMQTQDCSGSTSSTTKASSRSSKAKACSTGRKCK